MVQTLEGGTKDDDSVYNHPSLASLPGVAIFGSSLADEVPPDHTVPLDKIARTRRPLTTHTFNLNFA